MCKVNTGSHNYCLFPTLTCLTQLSASSQMHWKSLKWTYPLFHCVPYQQPPWGQNAQSCPPHWSQFHDEELAGVLRHPRQKQQHAAGSWGRTQQSLGRAFHFLVIYFDNFVRKKSKKGRRMWCVVSPSFGISGVYHVDPGTFKKPFCSTAVAIHPVEKVHCSLI